MKIYLPIKITNFKLYNEVLPQLSEYYLNGGMENPIISFINTEKIHYECIPLIMGILDIIYNVNEEPVFLEFVYRPHLLYCLDHTLFFHYAKTELGYVEYDKELIGGFSDYIEKEYREAHIMHVYYPVQNFFSYSEDEQDEIRAQTYEEMRYHIVPLDYGTVLSDIKKLWIDEMENCRTLLAELITNARLYSMSLCYALLHSNMHKTMLSICDVGNGFRHSLEKRRGSKSYSVECVEKFKTLKDGYIKKYGMYKLEDFFDIMEVLYYSELQNRVNLVYLKKLVVNTGGVLRIQTGATQVVFTTNRCKGCDKKITDCVGCLLKGMSQDLKYSSIKCFESKLKGVRIEIEFGR